MSLRKNCDELLEVIEVIELGFRAPLENITQEHLNYIFADHKMTIGQIAVHHSAWAEYFMSPADNKPWELVDWTCRPCEYPLTLVFVNFVIDQGFDAMREVLKNIDDAGLEVNSLGNKGPGYIIARLQMHALVHSNQMSYLRQLLDPDWQFGSHFGDMASVLINLSYHTSRDIRIQGF